MKHVLAAMAALSCLAVMLVSPAKGHDNKKCGEKSKGIIVIPKEGDDSCNVHFYWDGDHCDLRDLKGLKALDGLKALKGLDTCKALDDLGEALDELSGDLKILDKYHVDLDLNFDELEASLESLTVHIPPSCPLNLLLPPAVGIPLPSIAWNWHTLDEWEYDSLSDEEQVRLEAIQALERLDNEEAIPILENILKDKEHPAIRSKALSILGRMDDKRVVPILGDAAVNDPDSRIRKQAIRYLGQSKDKRALDILKEILDK